MSLVSTLRSLVTLPRSRRASLVVSAYCAANGVDARADGGRSDGDDPSETAGRRDDESSSA